MAKNGETSTTAPWFFRPVRFRFNPDRGNMKTKLQATLSAGPYRKTRARPNRDGAGSPGLSSILVATDLSAESGKALKYAVALAGRLNARVTLLHVHEPLAS